MPDTHWDYIPAKQQPAPQALTDPVPERLCFEHHSITQERCYSTAELSCFCKSWLVDAPGAEGVISLYLGCTLHWKDNPVQEKNEWGLLQAVLCFPGSSQGIH